MSGTPAYAPPPDAAGGFMVVQYSNGVDTHKMRVHLNQFNLAPTGASNDYNYTTVGAGETSVIGTFTALVNAIKGLYPSTWTFTISSLYSVASGVPTQVPVTPSPAGIAGTNAGADNTNLRAMECIFNMRSSNGHRGRLVLIGSVAGWVGPGSVITPTSGGTQGGSAFNTLFQGIVGYLTGANTMAVAHDGGRFLSPAHVTYVNNKRLRRHLGWA